MTRYCLKVQMVLTLQVQSAKIYSEVMATSSSDIPGGWFLLLLLKMAMILLIRDSILSWGKLE